MFFRKPSENSNPTNVAKKWIKHMDAVVTSVILGWIVASIYGVKKIKEREELNKEHKNLVEEPKDFSHKSFLGRIFGKK